MSQKLQTIPESLRLQAQQTAIAEGFANIKVEANGRDILLHGTVDIKQSVVALRDQLLAIPGVRVVRDNLTAINPAAEAAAQSRLFLQALAGINTADVAFEPGSINVTRGSDTALNQLAQLLGSHPDFRVRIEGHTDNTGPAAVNMRLSRERAQAVAKHLTTLGVSSKQLIAKGYGSSQPLSDNSSESGRARNRRIEISYVD